MLNVNKIEEISLDELTTEDVQILQQMQGLATQIETITQTVLGLQKDRERAWEALQEAEEKEKTARRDFLIKNRPDYKSARDEYNCFVSRNMVLTTHAENNLKLEEYFVSDCEQNIISDSINAYHWKKCKIAHESRVKLYREELERLSQYAKQRKEEFEKFELTAEFEIWGKADEALKLAISEATDVKSIVMGIDTQIFTNRTALEELTKKYDEAQEEHEQIFETIKALKAGQT